MLLLTSEETRSLTDSLNEWNLGEQTELYTCLRKTNITPGKRQSLVLIRKLTWSRNVAISCNIGRCFRPRIGVPADIICMAYTLCDDSADREQKSTENWIYRVGGGILTEFWSSLLGSTWRVHSASMYISRRLLESLNEPKTFFFLYQYLMINI